MVYPIGSSSTMWAVANLNATLELDTNATFANNFRANSPRTWCVQKGTILQLDLQATPCRP